MEENRQLPFEIKRVFYLYDVPAGSDRAGHAHKELIQFLVALSGSFDVHLDDGFTQQTVHLNRPHYGLLVGPKVWRVISNFSSNSVCICMASDYYDESSYYREYSEFSKAVHKDY